MSTTKLYFIPVDVMPQVRIIDVVANQFVAPTDSGAYYAVAGVTNPATIVVADPELVRTSDVEIVETTAPVGTVLHYLTSTYNLPVTETYRQWELYATGSPDTIIAYSNAATYTVPDVGVNTDREVRIVVTNTDYLDRTDTSSTTIAVIPAPVTGVAPTYPVGAVASLAGTGAVGTNGTASVSAGSSGNPTPTVKWQFYVDDVAGSLQTSNVIAFDNTMLGKAVTVRQVADNTHGHAESLLSAAVRVYDPAVNWVTFADADWTVVELFTAPEGRLQVTINASKPALPVGYSFYIHTSSSDTITPTGVRANGQLFTGTGSFIRAEKLKDTVVLPKIVQIKDPPAGTAPSDSDLFKVVGSKPAYTIQGITVVTPPTTYAEFPGPGLVIINDSIDESNRAQTIWRTDTDGGTNKAWACHATLTLFHAAYYGNSACLTEAASLLQKWSTGRASNTFLSSETGLGPVFAYGYQAQYEAVCAGCLMSAMNTPTLWDALTIYQQRGFYAAMEWLVYGGAYMVGVGNAYALRGRKGSTMQGEPNLAAGNAFLFCQGLLFFKTQLGKEWLAYRGFASVDAMMKAFDKGDFLTLIKGNPYKVGGVSGGASTCANLISTVNWANMTTVGQHDVKTVPTNAQMKAQVNLGTAWRAQTTQHTIDDLQGFTFRYMNRIFGMDVGGPANYGVEQGGIMGPAKIHDGAHWLIGDAVDSPITPNPTKTVTVNGKKVTAHCTAPDNGFGVPCMESKTNDWATSGNNFTNRRGVPIGSAANYPFVGQLGAISELWGSDKGSDPYGMRVCASYAGESMSVGTSWLTSLGVCSLGPRNFQPNFNMTTGWTESDANTAIMVPNVAFGFRSSSAYQWTYAAALTGFSGAVVGPNGPAKPGVKYMFAWQTRRTTGTSHRVRVRVTWKTSASAVISTITLSDVKELTAVNTTKETAIIVTAPASTAFYSLSFDVEQADTNGTIIFGGPLARYEPQVFVDWDTADGKLVAERARRGYLYFRALSTSGWKSLAKMCYPVLVSAGTPAGDQSSVEDWKASGSGAKYCWNSLMGPPIEQIIPWWRNQIQNYPAYGAGYSAAVDWEAPINFVY